MPFPLAFPVASFFLKPLYGWIAAGAAVVVLGGWVYLERGGRIAAEKGEAAARLETQSVQVQLQAVTANRDALDTDNRTLSGVVARQQQEADAIQAKADAALKSQQAAASKIRIDLRDARDQTATLIQQIQDARHAQPIVVSETVSDGFHPLIVAGLERLRCVQRAANRGEAPDGCRVPISHAAGGAGAAAGPGGAGDYRPGFDTQLRMLNDLWRLHDWGAACRADKRAIAESQAAGAQP